MTSAFLFVSCVITSPLTKTNIDNSSVLYHTYQNYARIMSYQSQLAVVLWNGERRWHFDGSIDVDKTKKSLELVLVESLSQDELFRLKMHDQHVSLNLMLQQEVKNYSGSWNQVLRMLNSDNLAISPYLKLMAMALRDGPFLLNPMHNDVRYKEYVRFLFYQIDSKQHALKQGLFIDKKKRQLISTHWYDNNKQILAMALSHYRSYDNFIFPNQLKLSFDDKKQKVDIYYFSLQFKKLSK